MQAGKVLLERCILKEQNGTERKKYECSISQASPTLYLPFMWGWGGRKGSGDSSSSIKTSCPDKRVAAQSHCSIKSHDLNSKYTPS